MGTLKVGYKITAIDPCEMDDSGGAALTIGKEYEVKRIDKYLVWIDDDEDVFHGFDAHELSIYFK